MSWRTKAGNVTAMVCGLLIVVGSVLPWGRPDGGAFDHAEAFFTLGLGAMTILAFAFAEAPMHRKVFGMFAAVLVIAAGWMAIQAINRTTDVEENPLSLVRGDSMQGGLWLTLIAAVVLFFVSLGLPRKVPPLEDPRILRPIPEPQPAAAAPPPPGAWSAAPTTTVRRLKCPRCSTVVPRYGTETPTCPNCGFRESA